MIHTKRLVLRPLTPDDLAALHRISARRLEARSTTRTRKPTPTGAGRAPPEAQPPDTAPLPGPLPPAPP